MDLIHKYHQNGQIIQLSLNFNGLILINFHLIINNNLELSEVCLIYNFMICWLEQKGQIIFVLKNILKVNKYYKNLNFLLLLLNSRLK